MTAKNEITDPLPEAAANDTGAMLQELSFRDQATKLIKRYSAVSAGLGVIPIPALDITAIGGSQFLMVRHIAKIYGIDLPKDRARAILSAVLGGAVPVVLGGGIGSIVKTIPVIGTIAGAVTMPSVAGLTTLTLGKVLADHLENGGNFDELDLAKLRSLFAAEFKAAKAKLSRSKGAALENAEVLAA